MNFNPEEAQVFQISPLGSSLCIALAEKDKHGQVTFVETNVFSRTQCLVYKGSLPCELAGALSEVSLVCPDSPWLGLYGWRVYHFCVAHNPLSEHHPLVYSHRNPALAVQHVSPAGTIFINAMEVNPNQRRKQWAFFVFPQLRGGQQFTVLLWLANEASGLLVAWSSCLAHVD